MSEKMKRLRPYLATRTGAQPYRMSTDGAMALSDLRTFHIPFHTKLEKNSSSAHIVIALTTGGKEANVAFVSGADELRKASQALAATKYPQSFPDSTPVRIVRKGVFSCSIYTKDCVLVLIPSMDAAMPGN